MFDNTGRVKYLKLERVEVGSCACISNKKKLF